jgi:hypothetical protein
MKWTTEYKIRYAKTTDISLMAFVDRTYDIFGKGISE